ncbi:MAG TPA: RHS repeat-associated core domain-containing protein [Gemmatimonadaceae bacterium]|nr:RHS repeat-associated core domain-containing protein [Gemmatimonadaceae bacterium]
MTAIYSGLGYLVHSDLIAHDSTTAATRYHTREEFTYDALGNALTSIAHDTLGFDTSFAGDTNSYTPQTGRLARALRTNRNDTLLYNPAGDLEFTSQRSSSPGSTLEDRASYYAADGRVRAAEFRTAASATALRTVFTTVFEQYRYDALGRRVLVWAQRWCEDATINDLPTAERTQALRRQAECNLSLVRRTVWAGDRELYEIQMPGDSTTPTATLEDDTAAVDQPMGSEGMDPNPFFGRVAYTYGLHIDEPLSITRINYADTVAGQPYAVWAPFAIVPLWNTRQQADTGFFPDGGNFHKLPSDTTRHVLIDWPMNWHAYGAPDPTLFYWQGTLLDHKRDKAETMYRRNRVYDPETGQFTQEDPIGLAGGLNLYGFADGDPVNLSDPFGLCPGIDGTDPKSTADCPPEVKRLLAVDPPIEPQGKTLERIGFVLGLLDGGSEIASGLKGGSLALRELFSGGSIRGSSIINIRTTLLEGGFKQTLTRSKLGYLFKDAEGEAVRIMRRGGGWDIRVQNRFGNYLDEFGNVAKNALESHGITIFSK